MTGSNPVGQGSNPWRRAWLFLQLMLAIRKLGVALVATINHRTVVLLGVFKFTSRLVERRAVGVHVQRDLFPTALISLDLLAHEQRPTHSFRQAPTSDS